MNKIGLHDPAGVTPTLKYIFNEDNGMEYEQYKDEHDQLYMTACHEDVGQVIWYAITQEEWDHLAATDKD